jgi:hypothetical protein
MKPANNDITPALIYCSARQRLEIFHKKKTKKTATVTTITPIDIDGLSV